MRFGLPRIGSLYRSSDVLNGWLAGVRGGVEELFGSLLDKCPTAVDN